MREKLNCPNCGAPIDSEKCSYCGTLFYDFSAIEIGKPCYLKIKFDNNIMLVKAIPRNADISMNTETCEAYDICGSIITTFTKSIGMDLSMEFSCVPFNSHLVEIRSVES